MKLFVRLFKKDKAENNENNIEDNKNKNEIVDEGYIKWKKEKEFKENIEKLEKLLEQHFNECKNDGEKSFYYKPCWYFDTYHKKIWWTECAQWITRYETILSKEYWFIEWLVINDKIDLDMVREKLWIPCFVWYSKWEIISVHDVDYYEQLLMLLSIQNNPIEFLLYLLR